MVFKLDCRVHISDPKKVADLRKLKYFLGLAGENINPQEYFTNLPKNKPFKQHAEQPELQHPPGQTGL